MPSPNIVLITADQLRKDSLSCYGGKAVQTPNIDRLKVEGTQFDRAYTVSPWCMPSRTSILTGRYPHGHKAYSNFRDSRISSDTPNLYSQLKSAGYTTSHVGKCHYVAVPYREPTPDKTLPYDAFRQYYRSLGIDHLFLQDGKQVSVWFLDDYSQELEAAGHLAAYRNAIWDKSNRKVFPFPGPSEWHPDSWVGRTAVEFIDGYTDTQPLFMWLSFSGPHFTFDAPNDYLERVNLEYVGQGAFEEGEFEDLTRIHHTSFYGPGGIEGAGAAGTSGTQSYDDDYWRELRTRYFANVAQIDDQIGHVLEAISRRFGDDVLIVFTADHGEMLGNHRLWGKHNCAYEDVLNVPLIVRNPGPPDPRQTDKMVMLTDIAPTCLSMAGVEQDANANGRPLEESIARGGYPYAFAEGGNFLSVTDGAFKYVCVEKGGVRLVELFDLTNDPGEFINLAFDPLFSAKRSALEQAAVNLFMDEYLSDGR